MKFSIVLSLMKETLQNISLLDYTCNYFTGLGIKQQKSEANRFGFFKPG